MSATTLIRLLQTVPPDATISTYGTKLEAHGPSGDATIDLSADEDDRDCCLYCHLPVVACDCLSE